LQAGIQEDFARGRIAQRAKDYMIKVLGHLVNEVDSQ
jgi:hypothetical protein